MIQIRKNVFETNSSSTHSICISKSPVVIPKGRKIYFAFGEYGWENDAVYDTASYLYTGIYENQDEGQLEKLKSMLDEMGVEYEFEKPTKRIGFWESGYVDHSLELKPFIEAVLSDKDLLARYLFGDSVIYTGNDNEDCNPATFGVADETYWDYNEHAEVPNPFHDAEHYDYFYKGN